MQLLVQALVISLLAGFPASVLLQFSQILPSDPPPPLPPLASCCSPHPIQDWPGLQGRQRSCTCLPPNTSQITRPRESASLMYISWPGSTTIAESKQSPLSEVTTPLCSGDDGGDGGIDGDDGEGDDGSDG